MKPARDPITLEVIKHALDSIGDEMALTVMRSAYSGIVRDGLDYSTALCDAEGQLLSQGVTTPLHLGSFPDAMVILLEKCRGDIYPEDVFIFNDPYGSGGTHLPDIYIIKPIFFEGSRQGFSCTVAHQTDIGGLVPGSNSIHSTEIFQEGLCIPTLKLYERGQLNKSIIEILKKNVRVPVLVMGDIRAQLSACTVGEKAFLELAKRYGVERLKVHLQELIDYTEELVRAEIGKLPDGEYRFVDYIDGLGEEPKPIQIHVRLSIQGDTMTVDFDGTSQQVKAGINSPLPFSKSAVYVAVRSVMGADIPNNAGYFRPIIVKAPFGSVVNPKDYAPCAVRGITGFRITDTVLGALAQVLPGRVPADGEGGSSLPNIGGYHEGKPFIYVESVMGTWGGRPDRDGAEGMPHPAANQTNQPIELIEATLPLRIERYGFVQNSGGAGKFRGGLALVREWRLLAEEAVLSIRSDKRRIRPYALHGGKPGTPSWNIINPGHENERILPVLPMEGVILKQGDLFRHIMPGGGGWGNPLERDPERVLDDVLDEKLTVEYVQCAYGVVIDPERLTIDKEATRKKRAEMLAERTSVNRDFDDTEALEPPELL
jgi:N-methylhydantoinase B